jgi:hypothetical protein
MNSFQGIPNTGLLKDYYPDETGERSKLEEALKRKREKLSKTMIDLDTEEDDQMKRY